MALKVVTLVSQNHENWEDLTVDHLVRNLLISINNIIIMTIKSLLKASLSMDKHITNR